MRADCLCYEYLSGRENEIIRRTSFTYSPTKMTLPGISNVDYLASGTLCTVLVSDLSIGK